MITYGKLIAGAAVAILAATPAAALTVWSVGPGGSAQGLVYTLSGSENSATQWSFTLDISNINTLADLEGGRTILSDLAWSKPTGYTGATLPGATTMNGGLNAAGCNGAGASQFCFAGVSKAVSGSTMQVSFTIDAPTASFASWTPHIKVDWAGSKNNYDLVSQNMTVVPEPAAYGLALAGLLLAGFAARRRKA